MNLYLILAAAISAVRASDYKFVDVAVYGLDRCNALSIGPSTDFISIQSPLRLSIDRERDLASASITIDRYNNLLVSHKNGAVVAHIHRGEVTYPDGLKNKNSNLVRFRTEKDIDIADARSGDLVVVYVPHSTRLPITKTQFYKAFSGRQHDSLALVEHFVSKHITDDATSRRFTLVVAKIVRDGDDAIRRRLLTVSGPEVKQASEDGPSEVPLSFLGEPVQQSIGNPYVQTTSSFSATNIPSNLVSPGAPVTNKNNGQTIVLSQGASIVKQPQAPQTQPLSFQPRQSGSRRL